MMMRKIKIISFVGFIVLFGCRANSIKFANGVLQITYHLENVSGVVPSYQTAIWLENTDGEIQKMLLVSEFLSYGGYNDSTICPHWSRKADWENISSEEFDAVTSATPSIGQNELTIDCQKAKLLPGNYNYFVEVHITEDYNVLAKGSILLGGEESRSDAELRFFPRVHPKADTLLKNVSVRFLPK